MFDDSMISEDIKKKLSEFNIKRDFVFKIATNGGGSQEFYIKSTDPHFIFRKLGKTLNSGKTTYKSKSFGLVKPVSIVQALPTSGKFSFDELLHGRINSLPYGR